MFYLPVAIAVGCVGLPDVFSIDGPDHLVGLARAAVVFGSPYIVAAIVAHFFRDRYASLVTVWFMAFGSAGLAALVLVTAFGSASHTVQVSPERFAFPVESTGGVPALGTVLLLSVHAVIALAALAVGLYSIEPARREAP